MGLAELRAIIQGAKILKKYWPYILGIIMVILMIPILLINILFSFTGWFSSDEEDPEILAKAAKYQQLAEAENVSWQQVLAVDLAWHDMDQDALEPEKVMDMFVYYEIVKTPVYKTREVEQCVENFNGDCVYDNKGNVITHTVTITTDIVDYYTEEKVKKIRSFTAVMDKFKFTDEQIEQANVALEVLMDQGYGGGQGIGVNENVLAFEPLVRKYAIINNIPDSVNILLAMIQQESGGRLLDVMQSSESAGLPRNTFTNPEDSIRQGVYYFANRLMDAKSDVKLALQSYNFGYGFIGYALERGGYSKQTAISFSNMMAVKMGWKRYGDVNYVDNVLRYADAFITGNGVQMFDYNTVYNKMSSYLGVPYLLGGRNPDTGPVDCSGLIEYVFNTFGINISGTAQSMYSKTKVVSSSAAAPGDLVFFYTGGAREISHVGMYMGDGQFINANSHGVSISSVASWSTYYDKKAKVQYVFKGYRRIQ